MRAALQRYIDIAVSVLNDFRHAFVVFAHFVAVLGFSVLPLMSPSIWHLLAAHQPVSRVNNQLILKLLTKHFTRSEQHCLEGRATHIVTTLRRNKFLNDRFTVYRFTNAPQYHINYCSFCDAVQSQS